MKYPLSVIIPYDRLEEFADWVEEALGLEKPIIENDLREGTPDSIIPFFCSDLTLDQYLITKLTWGGGV